MYVQAALPALIFYKTLMALAVGAGVAIIMWPFRSARKEWKSLKESVAETKAELVHQRENHLTHIEAHGKEQVDLLGKVVDVLDGVRLDLKEQTGFIQAMAILPKTAPTRRKR